MEYFLYYIMSRGDYVLDSLGDMVDSLVLLSIYMFLAKR